MRNFWLFIVIGLLVMSACNQRPDPNSGGLLSVINENAVGGDFAEAPAEGSLNLVPASPQQDTTQIELPGQQRIILKNAALGITVDDPASKIVEIVTLAESMGGWVVSSNSFITTNRIGEEVANGTVAIRVPAERLNEALERIKSGVLEVNTESITGQDVTQDYVDTSSRLQNLQATEQQLQRIMETAETVEDVLAVQRELTSVRGEIEIAQGRINFFDEAAAFSSIQVNVRPEPPGPVEAQRVGWNPGATAEGAFGALVGLLQFVVDAVIVLVIVGLPFALIVGAVYWLLRRVGQRFNLRLVDPRRDVDKTSSNDENAP